ncbi:MAG: serine/threonine protein kinase [Thermoanaerobaculia bacterium]|nr:serine/threonine protein kinase [Thermoanaerobaculia bacterium]
MASETEKWRRVERAVDEVLDGEAPDAESDPFKARIAAVLADESEGSPVDSSLAGSLGHLWSLSLDRRSLPSLSLGDEVGPYRLESVLGEGGMGTVFSARRADGSFDQEVALKVVHRPSLDETAIRRFLRERQILAGLKHPNIARLLDGGVAQGVPYLVMERIEGRPLTEYCERNGSTPAARIGLVIQICDALHSAHRRGVVHRDLKPSNLLVEEDGGVARVVVLDFGIAHVADTDATMTATGQVFGTPGYMSPEQALGGKRRTADQRGDIYSLGVVLYELLSGRRPFEGESAAEVLAAMLDREPVPLRAHLPDLPIDLATIVATCLARDPQGRYNSMRALADDLESYVDGRPIRARPVGWVGRLLRHARRRPRIAGLVLGAAILTLVSLASVALLAFDRARTVEAERNAALESRREAEELLDFMLSDLYEGLERVGRLDLLEKVARRSVRYFERPEPENAASLIRRVTALRNAAQVLSAQGDHEQAFAAFDRNRALLEEVPHGDRDVGLELALARSLTDMASMESALGDAVSALEHARRAVGISGALSQRQPLPEHWLRVHFEAMAMMGWVQREVEDGEEALRTFAAARGLAARGVQEANEAGSPDESQDWRHRLSVALSSLGLVRTELADFDSALRDFDEARDLLYDLVETEPDNTVWREELQLVLARIGYAQLDLGRAQAAVDAFRLARDQAIELLRIEPDHAGWLRELSVTYGGSSAAKRQQGLVDDAIHELEQSLEISRSLYAQFPDNDSTANDLAWDLLDLGRLRARAGHPAEAKVVWEECLEVMRAVRAQHPESSYYLDTEVQALLELGRVEEARPLVDQLLAAGWKAPDFLELLQQHGLSL